MIAMFLVFAQGCVTDPSRSRGKKKNSPILGREIKADEPNSGKYPSKKFHSDEVSTLDSSPPASSEFRITTLPSSMPK